MTLRGWGAVLALTGGLMTGCAPLAPSPGAPVERQLVSRFELVGRMAVVAGERSASMGVAWRHGGEKEPTDEWQFLSPLGQVVARIEADQTGATLIAGGEPVRAASAQELMGRMLGVSPPLAGIAAWVQAVPRDGARVRAWDENGRPASMADEGWVIDYLEYADASPDARPRRIEARWGDATLKLVIDQWSAIP